MVFCVYSTHLIVLLHTYTILAWFFPFFLFYQTDISYEKRTVLYGFEHYLSII